MATPDYKLLINAHEILIKAALIHILHSSVCNCSNKPTEDCLDSALIKTTDENCVQPTNYTELGELAKGIFYNNYFTIGSISTSCFHFCLCPLSQTTCPAYLQT